MPVKGKPGLTATIYVLLAILGLLVLIGVIIWMMVGGEHKNRQTGIQSATPYVASSTWTDGL
jgi:flagellar basal body-associated protein FliL